MKLFRDTSTMEKKADYSLGENSEYWLEEIKKRLIEELPTTSNYESFVDFKKIDDSNGSAIGEIVVGGKIIIPFFVKDFNLKPLDVFIFKGKTYPATRKKLLEHLYDDAFFTNLADAKDNKLINFQNRGNDMIMPSDYVSDKLSSEDFFFIEDDKDNNSFSIHSISKKAGDYKNFNIEYFSSKNFFNSINIPHKVAFEKLANGEKIFSGGGVPRYRFEFCDEKNAYDQFGYINNKMPFITFDRNNTDIHEGFLINKIADENGNIREGNLFVTRNGISTDRFIKGSPFPYDFPVEKIGNEIYTGSSGYFILDIANEKIAFGPMKISSYPSMKKNACEIEAESMLGKKMRLVFDESRSKIASIDSGQCFYLPCSPCFVSSEREIKLTKHAEQHDFFAKKKNNIFIEKEGKKVIVNFKDNRESFKLAFDSKAEAIINLYSKGIDMSTVADHILEQDDTRKWGFAAKLVWEAQENNGPITKETIIPRYIKEDGSLPAKPNTRKDHSDFNLSKKTRGMKLLDNKENSIDEIVSTVDKKGYDFLLLKNEVNKLFKTHPKIAMEAGFENFFKDVTGDIDYNLEEYINKIPNIKEVQNILSNLLIDTRSGKTDLPEKTLTNLVSSLGIITDSLEIFRDAR